MGNFFCLKCGIGQVVFKSKNCREYSCREHRFDKKNICRDCGVPKNTNFGNCSHKWTYC